MPNADFKHGQRGSPVRCVDVWLWVYACLRAGDPRWRRRSRSRRRLPSRTLFRSRSSSPSLADRATFGEVV